MGLLLYSTSMDDWFSRCRITLQESIILNENQLQQLKLHANNKNPNESCALLFGKVEDNSVKVNDLFLAENIDDSPINFTISNEELLKGYKIAEEKQLDVAAIFHSHPHSEAYPSRTDQKFMYTNPVVWIIYSNSSDEFKAYVLESEIKEISIVIS